MGRNLRVLRIDDRADLKQNSEDFDPIFGDGVVFDPLQLVTYSVESQLFLSISSLSTAIEFWVAFDRQQLPDIVLGDVDFEKDETSPLQEWSGNMRHIPTGLSHCKPLAAIAKAVGSPLSVMLYTANAHQWRMLSESGDKSDRNRVFGLLAAHEAMELAAILGEKIRGACRRDLQPVWNWLADKTESTPAAALAKALPDYRRQIVERLRRQMDASFQLALRVPAGEWPKLRGWCLSMAHQPAPLKDSDMGLPLLYPDGRFDRLSFKSLFADVGGEALLYDPLPSSCFDLTKDVGPIWELVDGLPRIGALIAECGEFADAVTSALTALSALTLEGVSPERNLRELTSNPFARGFSILFRAMQYYKMDHDKWGRIWVDGYWDPNRASEIEDTAHYSESLSLRDWVMLTMVAASGAAEKEGSEDGFVDLAAIAETLSSNANRTLKKEAIVFQLECLCQMGRAEKRCSNPAADAEYRVWGHSLDDIGDRPPPRPLDGSTRIAWHSANLYTKITECLGFKGNHNAVGQILHDAFLSNQEEPKPKNANVKAQRGRDFFKNFEDGDVPGWLVEVCRNYAREELQWLDDASWPICIRSSDRR